MPKTQQQCNHWLDDVGDGSGQACRYCGKHLTTLFREQRELILEEV